MRRTCRPDPTTHSIRRSLGGFQLVHIIKIPRANFSSLWYETVPKQGYDRRLPRVVPCWQCHRHYKIKGAARVGRISDIQKSAGACFVLSQDPACFAGGPWLA
eukprot:4906318-Pleurochrysis_carterae.AAC.2